jgi:hypothetical protein
VLRIDAWYPANETFRGHVPLTRTLLDGDLVGTLAARSIRSSLL